MSAKMHLAAGLIGAIGIVAAFAAPASAQGGVNVGTLTCNASATSETKSQAPRGR